MKQLTLLVLFCSIGLACSQNILQNPDFEKISTPEIKERLKQFFKVTECPDIWGVNPSAPAIFTVIADAETSHSGSIYLRVEQLTQANSSCTQWWVPVKAEQRYRQAIWAKGKGKIILMSIPYTKKRNILPHLGMSSFVEVASDEWKEYSVEFTTVPETDTVIVSFHMQGVVDLDDPSLTPLEK